MMDVTAELIEENRKLKAEIERLRAQAEGSHKLAMILQKSEIEMRRRYIAWFRAMQPVIVALAQQLDALAQIDFNPKDTLIPPAPEDK